MLFDTQPILPKSQRCDQEKALHGKTAHCSVDYKDRYVYIYIYIYMRENTKMNKQMNQQMKCFALFCSFQLCWGCKNEPCYVSTGKHASVVFRWSPSGAGPICSCSPAACHRALNLKHSALSKKRRPPAPANMSQPKPTQKKTQSTCIAKKNITAWLSLFAYASLLNVRQHTFHDGHVSCKWATPSFLLVRKTTPRLLSFHGG